jgi:hypothetical protein
MFSKCERETRCTYDEEFRIEGSDTLGIADADVTEVMNCDELVATAAPLSLKSVCYRNELVGTETITLWRDL